MGQIIFNSELEQFIFTIETTQTKHDFETVLQLTPFFIAYPELSFGFIPYFAASTIASLDLIRKYRVPTDYYESNIVNEEKMKDIRTKIKIFDTRYSASLRMLMNVDYIQNEIFKKMNKLYCFVNQKPHPNLGIFTDDQGRIIGNTHYAYYVMFDSKVLKKSQDDIRKIYSETPGQFSFRINRRDALNTGQDIGKIVGSILVSLIDLKLAASPEVENYRPNVYYSDVNTNHRALFTHNISADKSIFLFILHILTSINFVLYVANTCEKNDTGWWLKTNYMAYHYCISRLRDLEKTNLKSGIASGDLSDLLKELALKNENLLCPDFRNCIMHASFSNDGILLINERYLNPETPLFGLVETYFNGASYLDVKNEIIKRLIRISTILSNWLDLNLSVKLMEDQNKRKWTSYEELRSKLMKS